MSLKTGDFILLDYTARIKETGELFDTTSADVAKKEGVYRQDVVYEPILVVVGERWVVPGLDKELLKSSVGERRVVEVPPAEAFGERDQAKIRIVPERELIKQGVRPEVGQRLEVNGQVAVVRSISGGRVQLDFNHPHSGKTLVYEFEVKKVIIDQTEKALALIHRYIPSIASDKFKLTFDGASVRVELPEDVIYSEGVQSFKIRVARDLIKYLDNVETVEFLERFTYKLKEEKKSEETPSVQQGTQYGVQAGGEQGGKTTTG
ncbi:MAG: FKBP-type peptidyl-prolyl cis-trans isomerase [Thermoprotei archaeon]